MLWDNKKGEAPAFNVIIYAVLGLVFLGMFIAILIALQDDLLSAETWQQGACMLTNTLDCNGGIFTATPSLCSLEILEEPIDEEKFASLLRATYWMYKRGECDFGIQEDTVYPVYAFTVEDTIDLEKFLNSLTQRKDGELQKKDFKIQYSDLAYLEEGTAYQTLCFDTGDEEGIANKKLVKDTQYYIIYYDDASQLVAGILSDREKSDAILISDDPTFDKELFEQFLVTNTPLAGSIPGALYAEYVLEKTNEERGCLSYGGGSPNE